MLRWSRFRLSSVGTDLYGSASDLPVNFFACCRHHFGIVLHVKLFIGARTSQMRGLYVSLTQSKPVPANQPLFTIPLHAIYTLDNIATKSNALPHVRPCDLIAHIPDAEFKTMHAHLFMGLQFGAITSAVPNVARVCDVAELQQLHDIRCGAAMPWARILDDEDFNEEFIWSMYGSALDSWQRASYHELTQMLHRSISSIHRALQPPFTMEHYRRMTRLVLARAEHVPTAHYLRSSRWRRRLDYLWRRVQQRIAALGRRRKDEEGSRTTIDRRSWSQATTQLAMVPLLDLVNHSNRPNCAVRLSRADPLLGGQPALTLYSLCPIEAGHELCRHYNFALSRPNALFRYGFLPFDVLSIVNTDSAKENYFARRSQLKDESDDVVAAREREEREVSRLEKIFQHARRADTPRRSG